MHVRDLARERTVEAIHTLTAIMQKGKTEAARVRAAEALLDRGWGHPTQPLDFAGTSDLIIRYVDDWRDSGTVTGNGDRPATAHTAPARALPPGRDD